MSDQPHTSSDFAPSPRAPDPGPYPDLSFDRLLRLARLCRITDQQSGQQVAWTLNTEQRLCLEAMIASDRVICAKPRQVGCTSVCLFLDLVHCIVRPDQVVALVAHDHQSAVALLRRAKGWCQDLGIPLSVANETRLVLPNRSELLALTGISPSATGDSKVGRSRSFNRVHVTEFSFFHRAQEVLSALSDALSGPLVIESTAAAGASAFRTLWTGQDVDGAELPGRADWHRVWLPFTLHEAYRHDPAYLTDDEWRQAQAEGHTNRSAAAWWYLKLRTTKLNNRHLMRREQPVVEADMWSAALGKWISDYVAAKPIRHTDGWRVYADLEQGDAAVAGVDCAHGVGADYSAIAVISHSTGRLLATWVSNTTSLPAFEQVIVRANSTWNFRRVCVETNGGRSLGQGVAEHLALARLPVHPCFAHAGEKPHRMDLCRHAIESGQVVAGPELQAEVQSSTVDFRGQYAGRDDLLNALGHALVWRTNNPLRPTAPEPDRRAVYVPGAEKRRTMA